MIHVQILSALAFQGRTQILGVANQDEGHSSTKHNLAMNPPSSRNLDSWELQF